MNDKYIEKEEDIKVYTKAISYFLKDKVIKDVIDTRSTEVKHLDYLVEFDNKDWIRVECKSDKTEWEGFAFEICGYTKDTYWCNLREKRLDPAMYNSDYDRAYRYIRHYIYSGHRLCDGLLCCEIDEESPTWVCARKGDDIFWLELSSLQRWAQMEVHSQGQSWPIFRGVQDNKGYVSYGFSIPVKDVIYAMSTGEIIGKVESVKTIMGII